MAGMIEPSAEASILIGRAGRENNPTTPTETPTPTNPIEERFDEQLFLIRNIATIAANNTKKDYDTFTILEGEPSQIVSKLFYTKGMEKFVQLSNVQKALLVPRIKLFKVVYEGPMSERKIKSEKQFAFHEHYNSSELDRITKSGIGRTNAVGLRSVDITFDTDNIYTSDKVLSANIKVFFQSVESLAYVSPNEDDANFIDLIFGQRMYDFKLKDNKGRTMPPNLVYHPTLFRIKAVVGWSCPKTSEYIPPDLQQAIESLNLVCFLDLVTHQIDFNEDGSVVLSVDYKGSVESTLDSPDADLLKLDNPETLQELEEERELIKARFRNEQEFKTATEVMDSILSNATTFGISSAEVEKLKIDGVQAADDIVPVYIQTKQGIEMLKAERYRKLFTQLEGLTNDPNDSRIFFYQLTSEMINNFTKNPWLFEILEGNFIQQKTDGKTGEGAEQMATTSQAIADDAANKTVNAEKLAADNVSKKTPEGLFKLDFVYFGDILDAAIKACSPEGKFFEDNRIKFLVGPIDLLEQGPLRSRISVNIADVPISLSLLINWYTQNVVKTKIEKFPLLNFIQQSLIALLTEALGKSTAKLRPDFSLQIPQLRYSIFSSDSKNGSPTIPRGQRIKIDTLKDNLGTLTTRGIEPSSTMFHYVLMMAKAPPVTLTGDYKKDIAEGIYHFNIGSDHGLVKKIQFSKVDTPYLSESRINRMDQDQNAGSVLREFYDATVIMVGNNLVKPGSYIFINPSVIGLGTTLSRNSISYRLGLGGYFMVTQVQHSLAVGVYETTLKCTWQHSGIDSEPKAKELESVLGSAKSGAKSALDSVHDIYKKTIGVFDQ